MTKREALWKALATMYVCACVGVVVFDFQQRLHTHLCSVCVSEPSRYFASIVLQFLRFKNLI